jgi:hypothetical protein
MGGGTDEQTIAELKAQNDKLMAERVITRNLLNAQSKRMDGIERRITSDEVTSAVNQGVRAIADSAVKACHDWLEDQHARWQSACADTLRACFLTDQMYTLVITAMAKPSILDAVFTSLVSSLIFINPEFSMFQLVLESKMPGKDKEIREKRIKTVGIAKEFLTEAFDKAKEAFEKGEDMEVERHESHLEARLKFFQDLMEGCAETSEWITECYSAFKYVLRRVPADQAVAVTNGLYVAWKTAVGEARRYHSEQVKQLSLLFLYDLLRAYCSQNVKVCMKGLRTFGGDCMLTPVSKAKAIDIVADDDDLIDFDGLDEAKRKVMYEFFADITKLGPNRARIAEDKDLVLDWDFANY